jgi:hypothetical protein
MTDKKDDKPTLFNFINQLTTKSKKYKYDKKIASAFMLTQWISHDKELVKKCNNINKYQFLLSDESVYNYYMSAIPAGKRYIPWVKKRKADDLLKQRIKKLQTNFPTLSTNECKMIISFLQKNVKGEKK